MESKNVCILILLVVLGCTSLWGQSNELLDGFLGKESADVQTSLLLLAQSLEELPSSAGTEEALAWAGGQSWWKSLRSFSPEDPIPAGRFFLILFRSYDIRGKSLMYALFKTPRYAAREASEQGFCSGPPYYNRDLQPSEVLFALSMAMEVSHE